MGEVIMFWVLASGIILSAVWVILPPMGRKPVHCGVALIACFFCLAGIYALLAAHLLAAIQVILYAGAILVLFSVFIMLLRLNDEELGQGRYTTAKYVGCLCILFVFAKVLKVLGSQSAGTQTLWSEGHVGANEVGAMLLGDFMLPFELLSLLFLVASIGAVIIARKPVHS